MKKIILAIFFTGILFVTSCDLSALLEDKQNGTLEQAVTDFGLLKNTALESIKAKELSFDRFYHMQAEFTYTYDESLFYLENKYGSTGTFKQSAKTVNAARYGTNYTDPQYTTVASDFIYSGNFQHKVNNRRITFYPPDKILKADKPNYIVFPEDPTATDSRLKIVDKYVFTVNGFNDKIHLIQTSFQTSTGITKRYQFSIEGAVTIEAGPYSETETALDFLKEIDTMLPSAFSAPKTYYILNNGTPPTEYTQENSFTGVLSTNNRTFKFKHPDKGIHTAENNLLFGQTYEAIPLTLSLYLGGNDLVTITNGVTYNTTGYRREAFVKKTSSTALTEQEKRDIWNVFGNNVWQDTSAITFSSSTYYTGDKAIMGFSSTNETIPLIITYVEGYTLVPKSRITSSDSSEIPYDNFGLYAAGIIVEFGDRAFLFHIEGFPRVDRATIDVYHDYFKYDSILSTLTME